MSTIGVVLPEEARNAVNRCARGACQVDVSIAAYRHKHSGFVYCHACALKINAACPEAPPFDLSTRVVDFGENPTRETLLAAGFDPNSDEYLMALAAFECTSKERK